MSKNKLTRHWLLTNIARAQRAQGKSATLWDIAHDKSNPLLSPAVAQKYAALFQVHTPAVRENANQSPDSDDLRMHVKITGPDGVVWEAGPDEDWPNWQEMTKDTSFSEPAFVSDDVEFVPPSPEDAARVAHVEPAPRRVVEPPGAGLMQLLDYLPARQRLRKDVEQVIADMREEHFECLAVNDRRGARVALWRGRFEVLRAIAPSWAMGIFAAFTKWLVGRLG